MRFLKKRVNVQLRIMIVRNRVCLSPIYDELCGMLAISASMELSMTPVLEVRNLTKRFPEIVANDAVSFTLEPGEIHAFLGENGAGKSTLMNMLYGMYRPDDGEILLHGTVVQLNGANDAIRRGLGMVHQHFMLVPTLTVTENIILGNEVTKNGTLDLVKAGADIARLAKTYGLDIPIDTLIQDLPVGVQQRVEIVKALYRGADILILDEPTAVLTPQEADDLFVVIRRLKDQGKSIIFISHKLREVLALADRISVLRRGKLVGSTKPAQATEATLAGMMVGRDVVLHINKTPATPGDVMLSVTDLTVSDDRGNTAVDHVSFSVRAGEIVGIAGVQGNGQTELVEAITGLAVPRTGSITLHNEELSRRGTNVAISAGMGHIPEDRHHHGLVLSYSIADNMVLSTYDLEPFSHKYVINKDAIDAQATTLVHNFDVRTPSIEALASTLSGGNQQKVVVARELARPLKLLVAAQPTRGLDVGSIEFIHTQIVAQRDSGSAVLLVSAELDEILSLADRILVMFHGRIIADIPSADAHLNTIGLLMACVTATQEVPA
jgi:simple sugar transport system ATP-binding protein